MVTWDERLATGWEEIDVQHRLLIETINRLDRLLEGPAPSAAQCQWLFEFLEDYSVSHFRYEEGCMERARCPAHASNVAAHRAFLSSLNGFKEAYLSAQLTPHLLGEFRDLLHRWVSEHILSIDSKLRNCSKQQP